MASEVERPQAVIVGGGVTGLTCAVRLAEQGWCACAAPLLCVAVGGGGAKRGAAQGAPAPWRPRPPGAFSHSLARSLACSL